MSKISGQRPVRWTETRKVWCLEVKQKNPSRRSPGKKIRRQSMTTPRKEIDWDFSKWRCSPRRRI